MSRVIRVGVYSCAIRNGYRVRHGSMTKDVAQIPLGRDSRYRGFNFEVLAHFPQNITLETPTPLDSLYQQ